MVEGVYFITSGEFEVTQKIVKQSQGTKDETSHQHSHSNKTQNKKIQDLMRSRSQVLLQRLGGDNQISSSAAFKLQKVIRLYLVGINETFGLEEIIDNSKVRKMTVQCTSTNASVYFLSQENFIDCVN